jgi:hypothetical protein
VNVAYPLHAFYDIPESEGEVLFYSFVPYTIRDFGLLLGGELGFIIALMYQIALYIVISLLISPLLGHRPSLWIIHKEKEP